MIIFFFIMKAEKVLTCDAKGNLRFHITKPSVKENPDEITSRSLNRNVLNFPEEIIIVHDDLNPWAAMVVGLDGDSQLVVELSYDRTERYPSDTKLSFEKRIIVSQKGIQKLLYQMRTSLAGLTEAFADEFAYYEVGEESWDIQEVFDIYNEILSYLESLNIRYRIEKEYN